MRILVCLMYPTERGMATHSSVLTWKIPWSEELDGLQSMGLRRVRHDCTTNTFTSFSHLDILDCLSSHMYIHNEGSQGCVEILPTASVAISYLGPLCLMSGWLNNLLLFSNGTIPQVNICWPFSFAHFQ